MDWNSNNTSVFICWSLRLHKFSKRIHFILEYHLSIDLHEIYIRLVFIYKWRNLMVSSYDNICKLQDRGVTVYEAEIEIHTGIQCILLPAKKYPPTLPRFRHDDWKRRTNLILDVNVVKIVNSNLIAATKYKNIMAITNFVKECFTKYSWKKVIISMFIFTVMPHIKYFLYLQVTVSDSQTYFHVQNHFILIRWS